MNKYVNTFLYCYNADRCIKQFDKIGDGQRSVLQESVAE